MEHQHEHEEEDIIMMPETNPLELSFHEIPEGEGRGVKELSFKKCFEADKYLLGAERRQKMFWLANDTLNLVRPSSKRRASGKKESYCVPELLQERERKFEEELKYVEEQKNRKIQELEHKLRSLQSESLNMKEKIVEQDREIRLIKTASEADSRLNHHNYLEDQNFLFKQKLNSVHKSHKDRSFLADDPKQPKCLDPEGRLINARHFAPHLAALASDKQKKLLLKNKELLLKNDDIEIGCMSKHNGQALVVTFYITPETDVSMTYSLESADQCLQIAAEPKSPIFIKRKKQEKLTLTINLLRVPYLLPHIEFVYK